MALVVGIVLNDFAKLGIPILVAARPIALGVVVALAAYALLLLLFRRATLAAFGSMIVVVAAASPVADAMAIAASGGIALMAGVIALWRFERLHWGQTAERAVRTLSVSSAIVGLASLAAFGALRFPGFPQESSSSGPPIHVILLDGYPRHDILAQLGFSNEEFLAKLEARGFDVARDSSANYTRTQLTLASMLHMEHVPSIDALSGAPSDPEGQMRLLSQALSDGPALEYLRAEGYAVTTVPSMVSDVTVWSAEQLAAPVINDYEIDLLMTTAIGRLVLALFPDLLAESHRESIVAALETTVAAQSPGRFVLTHVMSPHTPYVFGPKGEPRRLAPCAEVCWYFAVPPGTTFQPFLDQVEYLNTLVLSTVDRLTADAVVVVMSDHGVTLEREEDRFRNLLAVRSPGHAEVLEEDSSVITVLPRLFNAYFDAGLTVPQDAHFVHGPGRLQLRPAVMD